MWQENREWLPAVEGVDLARQAWDKGIGVFATSAVGRLFDAAAALISARNICSFEGQGPMELEQMAQDPTKRDQKNQLANPVLLPLAPDEQGLLRSDWAPLLPMLTDQSLSEAVRAEVFHISMAQALADQAIACHKQAPFQAVGLSGGVFQNRRLTELVLDRLGAAGLDCRLHQDIPSNDGGLCFGQIMEALAAGHQQKRGSKT